MSILIKSNIFYTEKDMLLFKFKCKSMTLSEYRSQRKANIIIGDPLLPEALLNICSQVTGSDYEQTLSRNKKQEAVFARFLVMHFLRRLTGMSLEKIGQACGGRDHATVLWGLKTIKEIADGSSGARDYRRPWLFDAHKRVQNKLGKQFQL